MIRNIIISLIVLSASIHLGISSDCKSKRGKPCLFPFVYGGVTYEACTTADNGNKYWCATSVNGKREVNDYDECSLGCAKHKSKTPIGGCLTTSGKHCRFPFKYHGVTHETCTSEGYHENTWWCATNVDQTGEVKSYGICSPDCPMPSTLPPNECGTLSGNRCVFPFVYSGVIYNSCTTVDNYGEPWCATSTDPSTKDFISYETCRITCKVETGEAIKTESVGSISNSSQPPQQKPTASPQKPTAGPQKPTPSPQKPTANPPKPITNPEKPSGNRPSKGSLSSNSKISSKGISKSNFSGR